ncbi:MAG: hypothetical protein ACR2QG_12065, partial [Gammaproteobacteria bacterium]
MNKLITLTALGLIGVGTAQAGPVTIDFEDTLPLYFNVPSYSEEGFTIASNTPDSTLIDVNNIVRQNIGIFSGGTNSQSIFWGANGENSTLTLTNDGGNRFSVFSIDASSLYNAAGVLTVSGTKYAGGATVTENIVLSDAISTYALTSMIGVTDMTISFDGATYFAPYDLDNINMSVV